MANQKTSVPDRWRWPFLTRMARAPPIIMGSSGLIELGWQLGQRGESVCVCSVLCSPPVSGEKGQGLGINTTDATPMHHDADLR